MKKGIQNLKKITALLLSSAMLLFAASAATEGTVQAAAKELRQR